MVHHRYINPAIGDIPLRRLRSDHLDDLYEQLATTGGRQGTGLAPKTIAEVHMIVRAALDDAGARELVSRNVAHHVRSRRRPPAQAAARSWTALELNQFLTAARSQRLYPDYTLLLIPGCDAVKSSDSNGPTSTLRGHDCRSHARCRTSAAARSSSASRHAPAVAPLNSITRPVTSSSAGGGGFNATCSPTPPMTGCSATHAAGCSTPNRSRNSSTGSSNAAPLRASASTTCAYTHASLLVADGVAIKVVSERLGHAHPAFTMHTYQQLLPGISAAAAEQFAKLVVTATR